MAVKLNIRTAPAPELNSINVNPSLPGPVGVSSRHGRHEQLEPLIPDDSADDASDDTPEDTGNDGGEPDSDDVEENAIRLS